MSCGSSTEPTCTDAADPGSPSLSHPGGRGPAVAVPYAEPVTSAIAGSEERSCANM